MTDRLPDLPGGAHLRTIALPREANAAGDIFGGWTLSQMDLAGGTFAATHSGKRALTCSSSCNSSPGLDHRDVPMTKSLQNVSAADSR